MFVYDMIVKYDKRCVEDISSVAKPEDLIKSLRKSFDKYPNQEQFIVIHLNAVNKPLGKSTISLGTVNQTLTHPRDVFRGAISGGATSIIVAHNHPSGVTKASEEDKLITRRLCEAGKLLQIPLLDHLIVAPTSWSSLRADQPELFQ